MNRESNEDLTKSFTRFAEMVAKSIEQPQVYMGALPSISDMPKLREVADLFGITARSFRRQYLDTGDIKRLPGTYAFAREDVLQLFLMQRRLTSGKRVAA